MHFIEPWVIINNLWYNMPTGATIRVARPEDRESVDGLLEASYPTLMRPHYDEELLAKALPALTRAQTVLLRSGTFYMAETARAEFVGCGGWTHERPGHGDIEEGLAHIRHFATHPDWTGRGIGRALYEACARDARAQGATRFECQASLNAEGFHAALGFEAVRRMNFPMVSNLTVPGVLMKRVI